MKSMNRWLALLCLSPLAAGTAARAGSEATRVVNSLAEESVFWETAYTNRVPICWEACPSATSAELTGTCLNGSVASATFSSDNADAAWAFPADADEDLYTLVLSYKKDGATLLTVTSRVARVKGLDAKASPVDFGTEALDNTSRTSWNRICRPGATTDNAVLALEASSLGATGTVDYVAFAAVPKEAAANVVTQTFAGASGYIGWKFSAAGLPYGWYTLEATFSDGTALAKDDFRTAGGTVYSFR